MGALSTAAMQKAYRELEGAGPGEAERCRWTWFRRYLGAITHGPLRFLWKAIPDPVDFFADTPPVKDLSAPKEIGSDVYAQAMSDPKVGARFADAIWALEPPAFVSWDQAEHWLGKHLDGNAQKERILRRYRARVEAALRNNIAASEPAARRHFHLLTKLGIWLSRLPVRVSTLAALAVHRVRWKERYGWWRLSCAIYYWNWIKAVAGVWWHVMRSPHFLAETSFGRRGFRPLFGWRVWIGTFMPMMGGLFWASFATLPNQWLLALVRFLLPPLFAAAILIHCGRITSTFLLKQLNLERGLLSQFEFRRAMFDLFGCDRLDPKLTHSGSKPMHLLLVCAALERTKQVWPKNNVDLVTALSAAMARAGLFPPVQIAAKHMANYGAGAGCADVIDGVAVRSNPIPAFFDWCKFHPLVARELEVEHEAETPNLHVVYNVPIESEATGAQRREMIDIVDSVMTSLALEKHRDTRQEVRQTNFLARLESVRRVATGNDHGEHRCFRIFADEIAPHREITFRNALEPTRDEGLEAAAQGCANALETIYRDEIDSLGQGRGTVICSMLMHKVAPRRTSYLIGEGGGLPEVCAHCTCRLVYRPKPAGDVPLPGVNRSYGGPGPHPALQHKFPHLTGGEPRIVFLGSGGVFRGAFHIGVIGAMKAAGIYPDLVVGASVGALMGGALAAISVAPKGLESKLLESLVTVFLEVDKRVALTYSLKNAAKQLGVRARGIDLSPAELHRMVIGGSRADAGFAATGAPPALIDAISNLFMIPHRRTSAIASSFVAGHITEAVDRFLAEVRRETLTSLGIRRALMGTSLLEPQARELLGQGTPGVELESVQPYHHPDASKKNVSFFATTTLLDARIGLLLGRDFLTEVTDDRWDFISAALSSSAFPAVFSPLSESEVLPGRGRTDRLFADGGMFDNLPFFPAIEILAAVQEASEPSTRPTDLIDRLKSRTEHRDIIIAASLDPEPEVATDSRQYDTLFRIHKRAKSLSAGSKIETFVKAAEKTQRILLEIANADPLGPLSSKHIQDAKRAVTSAILQIFPSDKEHINPTFAFCASAGLNKDKVRCSIADGCFRSLIALVEARTNPETRPTFQRKKFPPLEFRFDRTKSGGCSYFRFSDQPLECPFDCAGMGAEVRKIRRVCTRDKVHKEELERLRKESMAMAPSP